MQCPACGSAIWNEQATACPNCGQRLSGGEPGELPFSGEPRPATWPGAGTPEAGQPAPDSPLVAAPAPGNESAPGGPAPALLGADAPSPAPVAPGTWPGYPPAPPGYGQPGPPGYAPPMPPGYTPGGAPPAYGQSAPPSSYPYPYPYPYGPPADAGYGQPAPPSYAPYAAPPAYAPYAPYAPSPYAPYSPPLSPLPAPRKRSGGRIAPLVVGIVAAVVVVCGGGLGLLYYVGSHSRAANLSGGNPFASPAATSTGPQGTVVFQDSMTDPSTHWANDPSKCFYGSDGYHVVNGYLCYSPAGSQTDFDVSVQVTQINGTSNEPHGLVFRATPHESNYNFVITGDSHWAAYRCNLSSSVCDRMIGYTSNPAIRGGLNVSNTLEVRAAGSHFEFFANGTKLGETDNTSLASGLLAVVGAESSECVFTNFIITRPS